MSTTSSGKAIGLGLDLVEVGRITSVIERQGELFIKRVFTEVERAYCESKQQPAQFYAARFAAKEAVAKAFGTGIGAEIGWLDIEVIRSENGAPSIRLSGRGAELSSQRGVGSILVSLTHTQTTAGASVVLLSQ
jgi:holo-[acyl-carrier protein] synthase